MVFCCILQYFVAKSVFFLQFTLFCRETSFGTIYAILRGEKFSKKLCPWRKNDKYEVWGRGLPVQTIKRKLIFSLPTIQSTPKITLVYSIGQH